MSCISRSVISNQMRSRSLSVMSSETLRLSAARNFRYDRQLGRFNTDPDPNEVRGLVEKERADDRVKAQENVEPVSPEAAP